MSELQLEEFRYWAIRRNRTNCRIRDVRFTTREYCLDNAAVCFAEESSLS